MAKEEKAKVCPITKEDFLENAKPIIVEVDGSPLPADVKDNFSSGSFGYYLSGKANVKIGGKVVPCQVTGSIVVIHSGPKKDKVATAKAK